MVHFSSVVDFVVAVKDNSGARRVWRVMKTSNTYASVKQPNENSMTQDERFVKFVVVVERDVIIVYACRSVLLFLFVFVWKVKHNCVQVLDEFVWFSLDF